MGDFVTVNGDYTPVVSDFNGTVNDDIFWYAQAGRDRVHLAGHGHPILHPGHRAAGAHRMKLTLLCIGAAVTVLTGAGGITPTT